ITGRTVRSVLDGRHAHESQAGPRDLSRIPLSARLFEGALPPMKQWFHNLKVSQKLALISIFFLMPDSLMLYFLITGINANIEFARQEERGNRYQRPLEELLEYFPEHLSLIRREETGDRTATVQLAQKQAQIDKAFEALEAVDAQIGADLQFTDEGLAK